VSLNFVPVGERARFRRYCKSRGIRGKERMRKLWMEIQAKRDASAMIASERKANA
jgi:hypothetical protein